MPKNEKQFFAEIPNKTRPQAFKNFSFYQSITYVLAEL